MVTAMPGVFHGVPPGRLNLDFIFMSCVGPAARDKRFELTFEQFGDALAALARVRYPTLGDAALPTFVAAHVRPLYVATFGEPDGGGGGDQDGGGGGGGGGDAQSFAGGSIMSGAHASGRRTARLVLTPEGTMPLRADGGGLSGGPAVQMTVAEAHPIYITDRTARYDIKLGSGAGTPGRSGGGSAGSASVTGGGGGGGGALALLARADVTLGAMVDGSPRAGSVEYARLPSSNTAATARSAVLLRAHSEGGAAALSASSAAAAAAAAAASGEELAFVREQVAALGVTVDNLRAENAALREENEALRTLQRLGGGR
jgi:hypothetical protein